MEKKGAIETDSHWIYLCWLKMLPIWMINSSAVAAKSEMIVNLTCQPAQFAA